MRNPAHVDAIKRGVVRRDEAAVEDVIVGERATQDSVECEHLDGHSEVLRTEENKCIGIGGRRVQESCQKKTSASTLRRLHVVY